MDKKLEEQIAVWAQNDEHDKIIGAIEKLPFAERDFETIGYLARAYNNIEEYEEALNLLNSTREEGAEDMRWNFRMGYALFFLNRFREALMHFKKADELDPDDEDTLYFIQACNESLPFKKRIDDFWKWFAANEAQLIAILDNKEKDGNQNEIVGFISEGTSLLSEDVHFNIGGNYEFTFSIEGNTDLFYIYPAVIAQMPEQFRDKWHFFPFNQGVDNADFSLRMYGANISMSDVRVEAVYNADQGCFDIKFYQKDLCDLPEAQCYNAYYIMMEIVLGEGIASQYIGNVDKADTMSKNMMPLPQLRTYIEKTIKENGKKLFFSPADVTVSYNLKPQDRDVFRYDVIAGTTRFFGLAVDYYQESTQLFDHLLGFGVKAAFLVFPCENEEDKKKALDFRYKIEDLLEEKLLNQQQGLGVMLGGAVGVENFYIDLLLFDQDAFIKKVVPLLAEYPDFQLYMSDFYQGSSLTPLFED